MIGFTCANCGHRHDLESVRRGLYLGARTIGDIKAAQRGRLIRRVVRRRVTRTLMRSLWGN